MCPITKITKTVLNHSTLTHRGTPHHDPTHTFVKFANAKLSQNHIAICQSRKFKGKTKTENPFTQENCVDVCKLRELLY